MPYSNYSKIRDMLQVLSRYSAPREMDQLVEEIRGEKIESFAVWRPAADPASEPIKTYCSPEAVRRLVRLAADLGLVAIEENDQCSLTRTGRSALAEGNYDKTLATRLALFLKESVGVTYSDIKDAIGTIRRPEIPSFDSIYRRLRSERELRVTEEHFRTLMYLLERCGLLTTQIRKIYFAPEVPV